MADSAVQSSASCRQAADYVLSQLSNDRTAAGNRLGRYASLIARTCQAMAARFQRGGKLLVFGNGACSADAQHVAIKYLNPIIVGKRALPARADERCCEHKREAARGVFDDAFALSAVWEAPGISRSHFARWQLHERVRAFAGRAQSGAADDRALRGRWRRDERERTGRFCDTRPFI